MNDLTPEQSARALELYRLHFRLTNDYESVTISPDQLGNLANTWLAVEAHILAAHECPTVPVWRPTTANEIQAGWEVRTRGAGGMEATWGIAHTRGVDGNWRTESGRLLTWDDLSWTYETTSPLPEPEPWDEALVGVVSDALAGTEDPGPHWDDDSRRVLDALAARGYLDRTGGER